MRGSREITLLQEIIVYNDRRPLVVDEPPSPYQPDDLKELLAAIRQLISETKNVTQPMKLSSVQAPSHQVLSKGSKGSDVIELQSMLGMAPDGDFGPQTERAVRNFQAKNGLVVDGIVGPATWNALGK